MSLEQFLAEAVKLLPGERMQVSRKLTSDGKDCEGWSWCITVHRGNLLVGGDTFEQALEDFAKEVAKRPALLEKRKEQLRAELAELEGRVL